MPALSPMRRTLCAALFGVAEVGCSAPQPRFVVGDLERTFQTCDGMDRQQCLLRDLYPAGVVFDYETMALKP